MSRSRIETSAPGWIDRGLPISAEAPPQCVHQLPPCCWRHTAAARHSRPPVQRSRGSFIWSRVRRQHGGVYYSHAALRVRAQEDAHRRISVGGARGSAGELWDHRTLPRKMPPAVRVPEGRAASRRRVSAASNRATHAAPVARHLFHSVLSGEPPVKALLVPSLCGALLISALAHLFFPVATEKYMSRNRSVRAAGAVLLAFTVAALASGLLIL